MSEEIIKEIFFKVKNLFIWKSDLEQFPDYYDNWRSYAEDVESGKIFCDDCDGFAMTCAELLYKKEIDDIRLVMCQTETGEYHLVCLANGFLLDNRQRTIWFWNQVPYTWLSGMRLSEPGVWRKIET